ncbi:hypothetical protein PILCRDRAFT_214527 [Piloderma croceum F 1598]|uniref:Uncharacterized protein n=1 Tax=Piloderma croceum (strain F 1598) TaxID=765440 RepID=A0A0C3CHC3_PILCF|nr:hypothetical protein PILCRDRAFT_214527 [Piloderma croceum F 1598]
MGAPGTEVEGSLGLSQMASSCLFQNEVRSTFVASQLDFLGMSSLQFQLSNYRVSSRPAKVTGLLAVGRSLAVQLSILLLSDLFLYSESREHN